MAWIEQRGRQHRVYERVDGRRAFVPFDTRHDAERFAAAAREHGWTTAYAYVTREEQPDSPPDPTQDRVVPHVPDTSLNLRPAGVTVGELCQAYVRHRRAYGEVTAKTLEQYESYIRLHIEPYFGDLDAGYVLSVEHPAASDLPTTVAFRAHLLATPATLRVVRRPDGTVEAIRHETRTLSPKTVRGIIALASSAYRLALRADVDRVVDRNPFSGSVGTAPKARRVEQTDCLSADQVGLLLDALTGPLARGHTLTLFLVMTGLRWAEATGLQVKHLHLDGPDPRVEVVTALKFRKRSEGGGWYLGRLKSHASRRTLGLPPTVAETLRPLVAGKDPEDLVFTGAQGGPVRHGNFVDRVLKVALAATNGAVPDTLRPHGLRHTCATLLLEQGRTTDQVSRQLGHDDSRLVDQVYGHFTAKLRQDNAAALEVALTGRRPAPVPSTPALILATLRPEDPILDAADLALAELDVTDLDAEAA